MFYSSYARAICSLLSQVPLNIYSLSYQGDIFLASVTSYLLIRDLSSGISVVKNPRIAYSIWMSSLRT